jgi:NAD(P)-dependent dehydrogenase (short-subunit alcohol dehydrogenase family)
MATNKKVCVIAGIGPGLGMGIARKFGQEGFHIAMISRSAEKQQAYIEELAGLGIEASGFQADLRDFGAVGKAFGDIKYTLGVPDTVIYSPQPPLVQDLRDWMPVSMNFEELHRCMDICCYGAINCVHQVAEDMVERGSGAIIITTSGSAIDPINSLASIALSMAAVRNYAFTLNQTLAPKGVFAGTVCLSLLVEPGDPEGDPDVIAGEFWDLHSKRDRVENNVRTDVDPHEHHVKDMERFGRDIPEDNLD